MKKKIVSFMVLLSLVLMISTVYAANEDKNTAINTDPFKSVRVVFTESGLINNQQDKATYEVWFNKEGHYNFRTVSGPFKGDYEIWDGTKLYQYTKITNELYIRENVTNPIPHLFFDTGTYERIISETKQGIFNQVTILSNTEKKILKKQFNNEANKKVEYEFTIAPNYVEKSVFKIDGDVLHEIEITSYENIASVSPDYFKVNTSGMNVTEAPK